MATGQEDPFWTVDERETALVATALHDGHALRREVAALVALSDEERLREEDPWTGEWTRVGDTRVVVTRSRFEVDLNRPRDKAVYQQPEDAWGLAVWQRPLPADLIERSLAQYDAFYAMLAELIERRIAAHGKVLVLDLHSYNHRRGGAQASPDDPALNPEVNVGTGTMDRCRWGPLVDAFIEAMRSADAAGRTLDVRENVKFRGGNMSRWLHASYPTKVCSLAIEAKKVFMDEWTGTIDHEVHEQIRTALQAGATTAMATLATL